MSARRGEAVRLLVAVPSEPEAPGLFALRALADAGHALHVRAVDPPRAVPGGLGGRLARRETARQRRALAALFDARALAAWWAERRDAASAPPDGDVDVAISLAGLAAAASDAPRARLGALAVEDPETALAGVVWGIVRARPEWIGVGVHALGRDGGPPRLVWWGAPQLAAGEPSERLLFRGWVDAVDGLVTAVATLATGTPLPNAAGGDPAGRPAGVPALRDWLAYLVSERGARAPVLCERAVTP